VTCTIWLAVRHPVDSVGPALVLKRMYEVQWRIYHWATWAMPPLNCEKNLAYGKKMQPKCAIFRQKSQKFSAEGTQPPPQTLPSLGREIPLTRSLTFGAAALDPSNFFLLISIITLDYRRIWEIESSASFVSRPRPIKWNAL